GLLVLLGTLRERIAGRAATFFWASGLAGATCIAAGFAIVTAIPIALTEGGSGAGTTPQLTYIFAETGDVLIFRAVCLMVGGELVTLAFAKPAAPASARWSTLVGGLGALASRAFFPFILVLLWAIAIGVWLLVADRESAAAPQPQAA